MDIKFFSIILLIVYMALIYSVHNNGKTFYDNKIKHIKQTKHIDDYKHKYKIYDVGHKYFPNLSKVKNIELITNIILFFPLILEPDIIKKLISHMIPIFLFRTITTNATVLPKSTNCDDDNFSFINFLNGHCYDKLFSGHFAVGIIISLLLNEKRYNKQLLVLYNLINAFIIISSRQHYTADVLFGGYVGLTSYFFNINIESISSLYNKV